MGQTIGQTVDAGVGREAGRGGGARRHDAGHGVADHQVVVPHLVVVHVLRRHSVRSRRLATPPATPVQSDGVDDEHHIEHEERN